MSYRLFGEDTLFAQRLYSCSGCYTRKLDGVWGQFTDEAEQAFFSRSKSLADTLGVFDPRTEANIRTLRLDAQKLCRQSITALRSHGFDVRVLSGSRTYAEQNALYRKGRFGNAGPVVTRARGGQSWHNFGLAWDIGLFDNGSYVTADQPYRAASGYGIVDGVEWGGNWRSFPDNPHYQTAQQADDLASARAFFEAGGRAS